MNPLGPNGTPFTLYGTYLSPYVARVRILLAAKAIVLPITPPPDVDPWRIYTANEAFRAISPLGKVPYLTGDALQIGEAQVICEWIEDHWPEPALRPLNPNHRALDRYICSLIDAYGLPALAALFDAAMREDSAGVETEMKNVLVMLRALERTLSPGPFSFGAQPSLADCALPPFLFYLDKSFAAAKTPSPLSSDRLFGLACHLNDWLPATEVLNDMAVAFATTTKGTST